MTTPPSPPIDPSEGIPNVIAPPPLLYAGTLLLGWLLQRFFPAPLLLPRPLALVAGAGLAVAAGALAVSAFRTMVRARTEVNPYRPTTAIVTTGPFRFSRNPIYLSLTLLYLAVTQLLGAALWPLLLLTPLLAIVQWGVIAREERYLEGRFGEEYRRFRARVRRWL